MTTGPVNAHSVAPVPHAGRRHCDLWRDRLRRARGSAHTTGIRNGPRHRHLRARPPADTTRLGSRKQRLAFDLDPAGECGAHAPAHPRNRRAGCTSGGSPSRGAMVGPGALRGAQHGSSDDERRAGAGHRRGRREDLSGNLSSRQSGARRPAGRLRDRAETPAGRLRARRSDSDRGPETAGKRGARRRSCSGRRGGVTRHFLAQPGQDRDRDAAAFRERAPDPPRGVCRRRSGALRRPHEDFGSHQSGSRTARGEQRPFGSAHFRWSSASARNGRVHHVSAGARQGRRRAVSHRARQVPRSLRTWSERTRRAGVAEVGKQDGRCSARIAQPRCVLAPPLRGRPAPRPRDARLLRPPRWRRGTAVRVPERLRWKQREWA